MFAINKSWKYLISLLFDCIPHINRYLSIVHSKLSISLIQTHKRIVLAIIWFFGIVISLLYHVKTSAVSFTYGKHHYYVCHSQWTYEEEKFFVVLLFNLTLEIPLIVLIYVYLAIGLQIIRHNLSRDSNINRDEANFNSIEVNFIHF